MARLNTYVPDDLYAWWREEAPDVVPSDFVREGLERERKRRRAKACTHPVRICAACSADPDQPRMKTA